MTTNTDPMIIAVSPNPLRKIEVMRSSHPLQPPAQLTSNGQNKDTGELVNNKSAKTWDCMIKKQFMKLSLGMRMDNFQLLHARNPANSANNRL